MVFRLNNKTDKESRNMMSKEAAVSMEELSTFVCTDKQRCNFSEGKMRGFERKKSILVVDDSESIRELLSVLLHEDGIVYTAVNGLDALSQFAGHHFDIVVSDIEMPVMNGIELYNNVPPVYRDAFLFFSGTGNEEHISYMFLNNLILFRKPDEIFRLQRAVQQKLNQFCPERVTN
jgi:DNA-binding NtrC family response regulator